MKYLLIAFVFSLITAPVFAGIKEIQHGIAGYKKCLESESFKNWVSEEKLDAETEAFFRRQLDGQIALWQAELKLLKRHPKLELGSKELINSALSTLLGKGLSEADLIK